MGILLGENVAIKGKGKKHGGLVYELFVFQINPFNFYISKRWMKISGCIRDNVYYLAITAKQYFIF